jgi:hypothetical protein
MQATHESGISCFNGFVWFMMLNVTFNWIFQLYRGGSFLLVEETGVLGENHRSVARHLNFTT